MPKYCLDHLSKSDMEYMLSELVSREAEKGFREAMEEELKRRDDEKSCNMSSVLWGRD